MDKPRLADTLTLPTKAKVELGLPNSASDCHPREGGDLLKRARFLANEIPACAGMTRGDEVIHRA